MEEFFDCTGDPMALGIVPDSAFGPAVSVATECEDQQVYLIFTPATARAIAAALIKAADEAEAQNG
jgi:hypothetical protein